MNKEIYHFGIPGMKWGVRRKRRKGFISSDPEQTQQVKDIKTSKAVSRGSKAAKVVLGIVGAVTIAAIIARRRNGGSVPTNLPALPGR